MPGMCMMTAALYTYVACEELGAYLLQSNNDVHPTYSLTIYNGHEVELYLMCWQAEDL